MGRRTFKKEYRVVVRLNSANFVLMQPNSNRPEAEEIRREIERHIDLPRNASVAIESETQCVCEHCGRDWTEDGKSNWCCDTDTSEREAAESKMTIPELEKALSSARSGVFVAQDEEERWQNLLAKAKGRKVADQIIQVVAGIAEARL